MFRTLDCIVFTIAFTRKREIQSIFLLTIGEQVQQSGGVIDCEIMTYCIAVRAYNLYVKVFVLNSQFLGRWVLDQEHFQLILCMNIQSGKMNVIYSPSTS